MDQDQWNPCWVQGSVIEDIVWIGQDVLAWCNGLCIVFFDIVEKRESLYWCSNATTGEGACCISAHSDLSIFAFAEKTRKPRILVLNYPSMTRISECPRDSSTYYLATAFTARDYIVSLDFYPEFHLVVWSWKTGEKIIKTKTTIRDDVGQILRVTRVGPTVIAQMGKTSGKLFTWELFVVGKVATLKDHEVILPKDAPVYWVDWCPTSLEPLLAITDLQGHIFLSNYDGSKITRIVLSQRCGVCPDFELPMVAWFRDGIILRTTFCQIRFFRKKTDTFWHKEWYVKSEIKPCILVINPSNTDYFFYHTFEGYLMKADFSDGKEIPSIHRYLRYGISYPFVNFIYPWCHHVVVTEDLKEMIILECYSGTEVSRLDTDMNGEITRQSSHPDYPMIAVTSTKGELLVISIVDPKEPRILVYMSLQRSQLDLVKFSTSGKFVVAAEKSTGHCYCVDLMFKKELTVRGSVNVQKRVTDIQSYETQDSLKLIVLFLLSKDLNAGQQLLVYDVPETRIRITEEACILDLPGVYKSLYPMPGNPLFLVGIPYLTRQLRVQKLENFKDTSFVDSVANRHQLRMTSIFCDRNWVTSAGFDGLIVLRDPTIRRVVATFMSHHRLDFGTKKTIANRAGDLIICLGRNGSLIAMRLVCWGKKESATELSSDEATAIHRVDCNWYEECKTTITNDYNSLDPTIRSFLSQSRKNIPLSPDQDMTWLEWSAEMLNEEEMIKCADEKAKILEDFAALKEKLKALIDANETCPELEKLPLMSFDLDKIGRDQKIKAARDDREDMQQELEHDTSEMERISKWLKLTFWDQQKVVGKSLLTIFGDKEVINYPTVADDPQILEKLNWARYMREAVFSVIEGGTFMPFIAYTEEQLREEMEKPFTISFEDDRHRIDLLLEEEDRETDHEDSEGQRAIEGTTTHRFIEQSPHYYTQTESYGLVQTILNNCYLTNDCERLRLYFNKALEDVYAIKEREMSLIQERTARIRYIDSELRTMFNQSVQNVPLDPVWHMQERPESIIKVVDQEVGVKPYISPSQQELLDKQAAEAERIRLLLLADDFRERALMAMMDGVLEVRWEDTLKIDIPKPQCMLDKKPGDYTAEEILLVKQYEKDVEFLREERERYRRILEADYIKICGLLQEGIDRFDARHDELYQLKIKIESAINRMELRIVRGLLRNFRGVKALEEEDKIKEKVNAEMEYELILMKQLEIFQNSRVELAIQYDGLSTREKASGRKFRTEFSALGKLNLELLERQYKRRPKTSLKSLEPSDLFDLGSYILSQKKPFHLPRESLEYLRVLEGLDLKPTMLLPMVEAPQVWEILVLLRRQKIDLELKIRAKQLEITNSENTMAILDDKIQQCRSSVRSMNESLDEMRKERMLTEQNLDVQLVLKMGQVEVNLKGDLDDTAKAILVPFEEIDAVNKLIIEAGSHKLDALTRMLNSQRGTRLKEWEHKCLKKRFADLEEDLQHISTATATKDMQAHLKRRAQGMKVDSSPQMLDREIEAIRSQYEAMVGVDMRRLEDIEKEIKTTRQKNEALDQEILEMNVARCEMEQRRDLITEARQREYRERKMQILVKRSDLIKKIQNNYAEVLALQTEHELLRLRKYPLLKFKTLDDFS